jgi:hypothetical protein
MFSAHPVSLFAGGGLVVMRIAVTSGLLAALIVGPQSRVEAQKGAALNDPGHSRFRGGSPDESRGHVGRCLPLERHQTPKICPVHVLFQLRASGGFLLAQLSAPKDV